MERTPWFSWQTPPERVGWYEVSGEFVEGNIVKRRWTGSGWKWKDTTTMRMSVAVVGGYDTKDKWRGLVRPNA